MSPASAPSSSTTRPADPTAAGDAHRPPAHPHPEDRPGADVLLARAEALRERLWASAPEADRDRRVSDEDAAAVREAGLLRLLVPSRFGGHASDLRTLFDVTLALGRGCTSTGWITGVLNTGGWMAAQFAESAQRDVWGTGPDAGVAGTIAPTGSAVPVDGGLRVSGRWGYCSGSHHCDWVVVGVPGADPERSPVDLVLLPTADVTIEDTWHVVGMRGTGSNTVVADDVLVPAHRVRPLVDVEGGAAAVGAPDPVHRAALMGLFPLSLLGSQIGAAEAALDLVIEKAPRRAIAYTTFAAQTDSAAFAVDVADASSRIEAAKLLGRRVADELDAHAREGGLPPEGARTRMRLDAAAAAVHAREAVDLLVSAHGTSSFAEANPLQRLWRDTAVASRHAGHHARVSQEVHGRTLLGLDPHVVSTIV